MKEERAKSPLSMLWNSEGIGEAKCRVLLDGQFHSEEVRRAFHALDEEHQAAVYDMTCYIYGVEGAFFSCADRPDEVRGLNSTWDPWVWRRFANGGEMLTIEWLNGAPPSIVDFIVPGSSRTTMTELNILQFLDQRPD